jgi:hypothetical protein
MLPGNITTDTQLFIAHPQKTSNRADLGNQLCRVRVILHGIAARTRNQVEVHMLRHYCWYTICPEKHSSHNGKTIYNINTSYIQGNTSNALLQNQTQHIIPFYIQHITSNALWQTKHNTLFHFISNALYPTHYGKNISNSLFRSISNALYYIRHIIPTSVVNCYAKTHMGTSCQ